MKTSRFILLLALLPIPALAQAEQVSIAVAANFTAPAS